MSNKKECVCITSRGRKGDEDIVWRLKSRLNDAMSGEDYADCLITGDMMLSD